MSDQGLPPDNPNKVTEEDVEEGTAPRGSGPRLQGEDEGGQPRGGSTGPDDEDTTRR